MGDLVEITTCAEHRKTFYNMKTSAVMFEVKASCNAVIGLSRSPKSQFSSTLITLGDNTNQRTWLKVRDIYKYENTPNILSSVEYRKFWLSWHSDRICLGRDGENTSILTCKYNNLDLQYISFFVSKGQPPAHWRFELPPKRIKYPLKHIEGGAPEWIRRQGQLPESAIIGGFENESLYIIRAEHMGSLTPGKFVESQNIGYIPWDGLSNEIQEFEVLCGYNVVWMPTVTNMIPSGAVLGGYSEVNSERLYVGRAMHEGHLIPGKVQPSHRCCYIPYDGKEISKNNYEILIGLDRDERQIPEIGSRDDGDDDYEIGDFEDNDDYEGDDVIEVEEEEEDMDPNLDN